MRLLELFAILTFCVGLANAGKCPSSHPHPYRDGEYCCQYNQEADRPWAFDRPPCDGGPLGIDSRCCKDDKAKKCPEGGLNCKEGGSDSNGQQVNYRLRRKICLFILVNGTQVLIPADDAAMKAAGGCETYLEDNMGHFDRFTIKEMVFDGSNWVDAYSECTPDECEPRDGGWFVVTRTEEGVFGAWRRETVLGASTRAASPTTGLTRAAYSDPPWTRRCQGNPKLKWALVRGKLRCVKKRKN